MPFDRENAPADSLLTIINDVLDFSKIEAGRLELESIDFNLRDCIALSIKMLAVRAPIRKISTSPSRLGPACPTR